jgi:hypothetical protein
MLGDAQKQTFVLRQKGESLHFLESVHQPGFAFLIVGDAETPVVVLLEGCLGLERSLRLGECVTLLASTVSFRLCYVRIRASRSGFSRTSRGAGGCPSSS